MAAAKKPAPRAPAPARDIEWPADKVERRSVDSLIPYARNSRTHSDEQVAQIAASMKEWGWTNPVLIDEEGGIIAGHGRILAARKLGLAEVPCMVARGWTDAQKKAYVIADNQLALNAGWDMDLLKVEIGELDGLGFDLGLVGFDASMLEKLLAPDGTEGLTDPDEVPEAPSDPVTRTGDVWVLGRHRIICGDSTQAHQVERLFNGVHPDCVLTDPPYCSGGFQEAGKGVGSIGSAKIKKGGQFDGGIANDKLSTRGYTALMKSVLGLVTAPILYAFTDWRMWITLYDLSESSGYSVKSMIVWDKGTPGMGRGWRTKHELVLFGCKETVPFDLKQGIGNVISQKRTGNPLHPTQKPVEIIADILGVTPAQSVYDPFTGSGTTLIACEQQGRSFFGVEMSQGFVDVAVTRWEKFTGQAAVLEGDGRSFAEVMGERIAPGSLRVEVKEKDAKRGKAGPKAA